MEPASPEGTRPVAARPPGPAAPAPPPGRARPRARHLRLLVLPLALLLAVAAGGYGYAHWRFGQIASVSLPGLHRAPPPGKPMVLLLVGSDSRAGLHDAGDAARYGTAAAAGGNRSDVMILVRVDPAARSARMLSLPRDLLVDLAGGGRGKLNAAFDRGPEQLIETIQQDLGVPINHYLLVNFDGFKAIVDALGGIRLDFPDAARDGESGLDVPAGCQHLDGDQALALVRARHYRYLQDGVWHDDPLSDLGRIRRQQIFLRVALQTAIAKGLTNPLRADRFIGAVVHDLTKDDSLSITQAVRLAARFRGYDPRRVVTQTLPTRVVNGSPGFGDVLLLQPHAARQAVDAFLGKAAPAATRPPATTGSGSGHAAPAGQPATPDFDPRPC